MMELEGKTALVTGGSTDIGRAACVSLAKSGANVVVNYFSNESGALDALTEIKNLGRRGLVYLADVTDVAATEAMVKATADQFGSLDILVNGVGTVAPKKTLFDWTESDWDYIVDATLKSVFFCSKQAAEVMSSKKWGRIINITTTAAYLANDFHIPYIAAKGGVESMSRALAIELAPLGITVNIVAPPIVPVERNRSRWKFYEEKVVPFIPMGRLASPQDIGDAVALFASPRANYITGQLLRVDGGWTSRPAYPVE
jgi:NAD(P)-dependent dehydrogenase (short-subunit alcohol dehydrogenase family)